MALIMFAQCDGENCDTQIQVDPDSKWGTIGDQAGAMDWEWDCVDGEYTFYCPSHQN